MKGAYVTVAVEIADDVAIVFGAQYDGAPPASGLTPPEPDGIRNLEVWRDDQTGRERKIESLPRQIVDAMFGNSAMEQIVERLIEAGREATTEDDGPDPDAGRDER